MLAGKKVLVKCGGFSTQLAKYVGDKIDGDPLWSARFDAENASAVIRTHLDFLEHGSQIILTNTYQSSVAGFTKYLNVSEEEAIEMIRNSVKLAKGARSQFLKHNNCAEEEIPLVMASIGPYGAFLHDYSEYDGKYAGTITKDELKKWHRPRIEACLAEGVDGLAIETIPCQIEAEAVVEMLLKDYPECKFYVSFQCKNGQTLADGENFADAVTTIWNKIKDNSAAERCYAIGINCVNPRIVNDLFDSIHQAEKGIVPLLACTNSDEVYNSNTGKWEDNCGRRPLASFVPDWIELGAKIVGGCCRVYPNDIAEIRQCVDKINKAKYP